MTSSSAEYSIWKGIIARCTVPATKGYKNYGGRGIRIHDDWLGYPEGFGIGKQTVLDIASGLGLT